MPNEHTGILPPQSPPACPHPQFEALIQFFLGRVRVDMSYDDNLHSVIAHNLASPGAFWYAALTHSRLGEVERVWWPGE